MSHRPLDAAIRESRRRNTSIDAARGLAMFFSCLSHFGLWWSAGYARLGDLLQDVSMVATPSFLLLSGAMVGMRLVTAAGDRRVRLMLVDRGLFLLTVAHVAIALAQMKRGLSVAGALVQTFTTDVIAVAMIASAFVAPWVMARPRAVLAGAFATFPVCWAISVSWQPTGTFAMVARDMLFGRLDTVPGVIHHVTPLVALATVYACGLLLGRLFESVVAGRTPEPVAAMRLATIGLALMVAALVARALMLGPRAPTGGAAFQWHDAAHITTKFPPTPAYAVFFGGAALVSIACSFYAHWRGFFRSIIAPLATIGHASLLVFVLQYWFFWQAPYLLGIRPGPAAPLWFVAVLVLLYVLAADWVRIDGNRYLYFGLKRWLAAEGRRPRATELR